MVLLRSRVPRGGDADLVVKVGVKACMGPGVDESLLNRSPFVMPISKVPIQLGLSFSQQALLSFKVVMDALLRPY